MISPKALTKLAKSLRFYAQAVAENGKDWGKFEIEAQVILTRLFDLARAHGQNEMIAEVKKLEPRVSAPVNAAE